MSIQPPTAQQLRAAQTVRGWPSLLLLGVACTLFVGVVLAVVTWPAEPPVAAQEPAAPSAALHEPPLGA